MPKVSFVIPTYQKVQFIAKAIDSIRSQTLKDWELIVIDDCSTDGTQELLEYYRNLDDRIKPIYRKKNCGIDATRNLGNKVANANLILVLDADDWADKKRAQITYNHFKKHPDTDLFHGSFMATDERETHFTMCCARLFTKESLERTGLFFICHSTVAYPKRIWEKYLYTGDRAKGNGGEWEFYWRLYKDGAKFRFTTSVLGGYRCGDSVRKDCEKYDKLLAKKRKKMGLDPK